MGEILVVADEKTTLPLLRFRVIAHSNSKFDQKVKEQVKNNVMTSLHTLLGNSRSLTESQQLIIANLEELDNRIAEQLKTINYPQNHRLLYGKNYFPEKTLGSVTYKEGYYESLVIILGAGLGDNWWCILYPSFCFLEGEENEKIIYTSLINEWIKSK